MHSPTVFVVAAESAVLNVLSALFLQAKLCCETFARGEDFLAAFDPERPGCLLLDMSAPGMGGAELHRMLVQRQSVIPVIIFTSQSDACSAIEVLKGGALDCFVKPFDNEVLLAAIKHAIELDGANRNALRCRNEVLKRYAQITKREREVLGGMLESKSSREIAVQLNMSVRTVEFHRAKVMKKMEAVSPVELVHMLATAFGCHCIGKHRRVRNLQSIIPTSNTFPFFG